jgi:hypothetical protein
MVGDPGVRPRSSQSWGPLSPISSHLSTVLGHNAPSTVLHSLYKGVPDGTIHHHQVTPDKKCDDADVLALLATSIKNSKKVGGKGFGRLRKFGVWGLGFGKCGGADVNAYTH